MSRWSRFLIGAALVILGINIIGLWSVQYFVETRLIASLQNIQSQQNIPSPPNISPTPVSPTNDLADLESRISKLESASPIPAPPSTNTTKIISQTSKFQKQSLFLGSASDNKTYWVDTGAEITLDSKDYPSSVLVTFEASLSIPGGEGSARLINVINGLIFYQSTVMNNNNTPTWKSSEKFALHYGENTYRVQLRSTSGETVTLHGARVVVE